MFIDNMEEWNKTHEQENRDEVVVGVYIKESLVWGTVILIW